MRPCAFSVKAYREMWKRSPAFVEKGIEEAYMQHLSNSWVVVECAKLYILKNWKRVKDWSDLDVEILDNTKKKTWYYSYKERTGSKRVPKKGSIADKFNSADKLDKKEESAFESLSNELDRKMKTGQNPVKSLTDVVLDPTDGDFSLTINGHPHLWIDSESIVVIAAFIENQIRK
jgi:hypothetical protein